MRGAYNLKCAVVSTVSVRCFSLASLCSHIYGEDVERQALGYNFPYSFYTRQPPGLLKKLLACKTAEVGFRKEMIVWIFLGGKSGSLCLLTSIRTREWLYQRDAMLI